MPSSKTWPHDNRPNYIVRNERSLRAIEREAADIECPASAVACGLLAQHYVALAAMMELKTILDNYVDGAVP